MSKTQRAMQIKPSGLYKLKDLLQTHLVKQFHEGTVKTRTRNMACGPNR